MNLSSRLSQKMGAVVLLCLCLLEWSCWTGDRRLARSTPNPILLLHGLGGKADSWSDAGLRGYFEGQGLRYGVVIRLSPEGRVEIRGGSDSAAKCDFEVSDPLAGLARWTGPAASSHSTRFLGRGSAGL